MNEHGYRIVIIEDEPMMLRHIKNKINDTKMGFDIVGTAMNGEAGLDLVRRIRPDILFTDIHMPKLDGLGLIELLREEFPELKVVIISGYSEFEYAQQGIKFGVKHYLLKPLKNETLVKALQMMKKELDQMDKMRARNILFLDVNGGKSNHALPFSLAHGHYKLLHITIGHVCYNITSTQQLGFFSQLWEQVRWEELSKAVGLHDFRYWIIDERLPNQKFIILHIEEGQEGISLQPMALATHEYLKGILSPASINICLTDDLLSYGVIWEEAQRLRFMVDRCLILGESHIIQPYMDTSQMSITETVGVDIQNKVLALMMSNDRGAIRRELNKLWDDWLSHHYPQRIIRSYLEQLLLLFSKNHSKVQQDNIYDLLAYVDEKLSMAYNMSTLYKEIWQTIEKLLPKEREQVNETAYIVNRIEGYMQDHYPSITSIENVADKFGFNTSYLIKIFKKYKHVTPLKYLTKLRIEEAKRLIISEPQLEVKYIGEVVGYQDQHYFSRIFKNMTGQSPSSFKETYSDRKGINQ